VATQQQVLAGSVGGAVDQLRDMAHHIADQSFEKLTGVKGAFSTRLLYVTAERFSVNNTRYTLQRSDYDGARAVTLLQSREPILSPSFAPDGKRIAYVSFEQKRPRIFVQHIDTGRREQVTNFEGLNGAPAWSPDGNRLAFVLSKDGNPEIYVMDMGSRQLRRVTNQGSIDTEPFWGKDGQTIYFTSDRSGKPQIYKANINSGAAERVTFVGNYNANPKLSADEKTLVMIHRQDGYTVFKVAAMDLQRGNLRILSDTSLDESPTVAPNGGMLIYATRQQGRGVLMLASTNGRVRLPLPTAQGEVREPSWSPYLN
jgi:TolB protein